MIARALLKVVGRIYCSTMEESRSAIVSISYFVVHNAVLLVDIRGKAMSFDRSGDWTESVIVRGKEKMVVWDCKLTSVADLTQNVVSRAWVQYFAVIIARMGSFIASY